MSSLARSQTSLSDHHGARCGDGGHLVDGEFAASEGVEAVGEFVGAAGDGDDLAGALWCEPGAPGEEQLGGVGAFADPQRLVGEHRDRQVDQPGVLGVEVPGDLVQCGVEVERFGLQRVGDGGGHGWMIVRVYEKRNKKVQVF